jgi:hypothetical protein
VREGVGKPLITCLSQPNFPVFDLTSSKTLCLRLIGNILILCGLFNKFEYFLAHFNYTMLQLHGDVDVIYLVSLRQNHFWRSTTEGAAMATAHAANTNTNCDPTAPRSKSSYTTVEQNVSAKNETMRLTGSNYAISNELGRLAFCLLVAVALFTFHQPYYSWQGSDRKTILQPSSPSETLLDVSSNVYQAHVYNITNDRIPLPLQVLQRYIRQHSVEAIQRDLMKSSMDQQQQDERYYAIAFYQCPLQAGNRLHHFWNGLLWSILTNRTVLWKYWDRETCLGYYTDDNYYKTVICENANTVNDCAHVLQRAPWMMSYDDWKMQQQEPLQQYQEPFVIPYHATITGRHNNNRKVPLPDNYQDDYGVDLLSKYPQRVVVWPMCHFPFTILAEDTTIRNLLLQTTDARTMVDQLYSLGADFMFGMLHKYTFEWAEPIRTALARNHVRAGTDHNNDSEYYTVALHSRHRYAGLDGCNIDRETTCLKEIVDQKERDINHHHKPIRVSIMSDRPCTVSSLTAWLQNHNMSALTAAHKEVSPDYVAEHGPFAGDGFFVDMALVSATTRDAFVGMRRTSSDLVRELVAFERIMEATEQNVPVDKLRTCTMANEEDPNKAERKHGIRAAS